MTQNHAMNLLPCSFRQRMVFRARLKLWCIVWGICLIGIGVTTVSLWSNMAKQDKHLASLEAQTQPLLMLVGQNKKLSEKLAMVTGRQRLLAEINRSHYPLAIIGIISKSAAATRQKIQVQNFSLKTVLKVPVDGSVKKTSNPNNAKADSPMQNETIISIQGIATDDISIATFILKLRESGLFEVVELKSSLSTKLDSGAAREFKIDCRF